MYTASNGLSNFDALFSAVTLDYERDAVPLRQPLDNTYDHLHRVQRFLRGLARRFKELRK